VGSGAGFPGLVLAIVKPPLRVVLMEPNGKRAAFLQAAVAALGVKAEIVRERGEEAARKIWRERFNAVTARAVAPLNQLCEYCLPLVRPGGWFLAMKGDAEQELRAAKNAIKALGGGRVVCEELNLPSGYHRQLISIEKARATPTRYPRSGGVIKKRPL
jgi:16S rRNA (guanine527-N7)-methyltransferase